MEGKTIAFRVDDDFHKEIKVHIAKKGINLKDYIIELIQDDLAKEQRKENAKK